MIRHARPEVKVIATEPEGAAMLSGKPWAPHKIQGWTPDLIPAVLNREVPHSIVPVTDAEAIEASRALARDEGIFCGISSGRKRASSGGCATDRTDDSRIFTSPWRAGGPCRNHQALTPDTVPVPPLGA